MFAEAALQGGAWRDSHTQMEIFRSLKYRNFKLFFYGQSVSLIGTWMQKTAVSWLVYRVTGSALLLGVVGFASLIPSLILSPYAGSFIDRHNRFKVLVGTQVVSMLQAGALALMIYLKYYNMTGIILLSLLQGIINAFDVTCRQSLMVDMVDKKEDLPNAIALNSTMTNIARIAGPAVAGVILSTLGEDFCFISNFLSYIAVLSCLFMMKLNLTMADRSEKNIWTELKEGFVYVKSDKDISSLILMLTISSLFVMPFNTLMPVFAKDLFNGSAKTFSWFESAAGLGALISAVYMAHLTSHKGLIRIMVVASIIFGFSVLLLSFSNMLGIALLFMMLTGVGMMAQTSSINTFLQTHSAPHMRGRTISYFVMAYQGMIPIGSLLVGMLADSMGPRAAVCIEGTIGIIASAAFIVHRQRTRGASIVPRLARMMRSAA